MLVLVFRVGVGGGGGKDCFGKKCSYFFCFVAGKVEDEDESC